MEGTQQRAKSQLGSLNYFNAIAKTFISKLMASRWVAHLSLAEILLQNLKNKVLTTLNHNPKLCITLNILNKKYTGCVKAQLVKSTSYFCFPEFIITLNT